MFQSTFYLVVHCVKSLQQWGYAIDGFILKGWDIHNQGHVHG